VGVPTPVPLAPAVAVKVTGPAKTDGEPEVTTAIAEVDLETTCER